MMNHALLVRTAALLASLVAAVGGTGLAAQTPERTIRSNSGAWVQAFGDYHVAPRWAVLVEGQLRRADLVSDANQELLRMGLSYDATKSGSVRLGAGIARVYSFPYGDFPIANDTRERRVWQQLILNMNVANVGLQQRFRLEQRWIGDVVTAPDGDERVDSWPFRSRARSQFRATIPFHQRPIRTGDFYAAVGDELFVGFGSRVGTGLFDQNRAYAVLGVQPRSGLRVEAGYLNVTIARANGSNVEVNHLLLLSLFHTASLF